MNKKALAAVAFVAAALAFGGLIATIQYYKNRPVAEDTLTRFTEVTSANFKQEIQQSQVPVYVVFYVAQKCDPCDKQMALVEKVAADYAGKVKFTRIDALKEQAIARGNGVKTAPTSFFINPDTGTIIGAEGLMTEAELRKFLDTGLAPATPDPNDPGNGPNGPPAPPVPPAKDNPDGN